MLVQAARTLAARPREVEYVYDALGRDLPRSASTAANGPCYRIPGDRNTYDAAFSFSSCGVPRGGYTYDTASGAIHYEEFHPFGATSYRAADSGIEVSPKRYRYVGKERDEETGLDQMGARYYAPWLGRWTAADPIGLGDGVNRYAYVRGNPVGLVDPSGLDSKNPYSDLPPPPSSVETRDLPSVTDDPPAPRLEGFERMVMETCGTLNGCIEIFEPEEAQPVPSKAPGEAPAAGVGGARPLTIIDFLPVVGGIKAGRESAIELADAIFEGRTEDAWVAGLLTFSNALFAIADLLTLGGATVLGGFAFRIATRSILGSLGKALPRSVVRASGENAGRAVLDDAAKAARSSPSPSGAGKATGANRLPQDGRWTGEPGNSTFIPNRASKLPHPDDPRVVDLAPGEGIPFRNGRPDFSRHAVDEFDVAGLTGNRSTPGMPRDSQLMELAVAERYGLLGARGKPTAAAGRAYLRRLGLVAHHAGGGRVQLVPHGIHGQTRVRVGIPHAGGATDLR